MVVSEVQNDPLNADGYKFATPQFAVPQGKEVQDCYFQTMPDLNNGQDYWIDHIRLGSNAGSHHLNIFRVKTVDKLGTEADFAAGAVHAENGTGECFRSSNWADWPLVANTQISSTTEPYYDWKLPEGVAHRFSPGERIMIQTHYVNASTQTTPFQGKVVVDFYRSKLANPMELGTLFATQQSIRVCRSNPTATYHGTCAFKTGNVTIAAANGHFHSRGETFDVFKWDGTSTEQPPAAAQFYTSTRWDEPPMQIYPPSQAMQIGPHGGIWWTCAYQWREPDLASGGCDAVNARDKQMANDCCYTFGPVVETSEHCNVFLYYYPKVDRSDITCF